MPASEPSGWRNLFLHTPALCCHLPLVHWPSSIEEGVKRHEGSSGVAVELGGHCVLNVWSTKSTIGSYFHPEATKVLSPSIRSRKKAPLKSVVPPPRLSIPKRIWCYLQIWPPHCPHPALDHWWASWSAPIPVQIQAGDRLLKQGYICKLITKTHPSPPRLTASSKQCIIKIT